MSFNVFAGEESSGISRVYEERKVSDHGSKKGIMQNQWDKKVPTSKCRNYCSTSDSTELRAYIHIFLSFTF